MKLARAFWAVGFLASSCSASASSGRSEGPSTRRVAIIGAGAAGASAAYHLRQFAEQDGVDVSITLIEKTDHIGGRTLTVNAFDYDHPALRVELGASIFIKANHILWDAAHHFNLTFKEPDLSFGELLGIWDGQQFVYTQNEEGSDWWNLAKLFWKYGIAPYRANKLVQATVATFLKLYDAPYFPFRSLTERAHELGLVNVTGLTGEQWLEQHHIGTQFSHDIIQAATRVNYAMNLGQIHGLDTMVALAPEGASQIVGGNWQIFDSMVKASAVTFRANTLVTGIARIPGSVPQYTLKTKPAEAEKRSATDAERKRESTRTLFDAVIVATPFQFSQITAADGVLQHVIDEIPYVELHVTLFASPFTLSPDFFGIAAGQPVPTTVLTTLAAGEDPSSGSQGAGKAGFFSISTLRRTVNPATGREEFLYKIFSPEKVTGNFLSRLLGQPVPDTIVEPADDAVVSWCFPHVFHSYPRAYPRVTFQDPVVGDGLYYTSGMESFISTMETSALMGKNVARLVVDDILGRSAGSVTEKEAATADDLAEL